MRLRRTARQHRTGVNSEDFWEFTPGQRVLTREGIQGTVTEVQDGPHAGSEQYLVELDGGLGGGEYGPSELRPADDGPVVAKTAAEASQVEGELHIASEDYPELGTILSDRPPLAHSERIAALRARAAKREEDRAAGVPVDMPTPATREAGVLDWWADKALKAQEESGYGTYNAETGAMSSVDWCRFRHNRRCFFPTQLDKAATEQAGHAVWQAIDRGFCPRDKWADQKACPAPSEPGPKSGERDWRYETWRTWESGGQGRWGARSDRSVHEMSEKKPPEPESSGDPAKHLVEDLVQVIEDRDEKNNPYGGGNPYTTAAKDAEFRFHITSSWRDVQAKAKRIRQGGKVRVISASPGYLVGEVQGDENIYQAVLTREPGTERIATWECGCAWASYSWGRSGRWKKYEGRLCSHALALNYEGQSRGWGGGKITEDREVPEWRADTKVMVPGDYQKPPIRDWRVSNQHVAYPVGPMPGGFATFEDVAAWITGQVASVESKVTSDVMIHGIQHNGEMVGLEFKIKAYDSLLRKLNLKASQKGLTPGVIEEPFRLIKDALRYTVAFPEPGWGDAVQDTLYELQGLGYRITEEENTWRQGDPYSGLHYNLVVPNSDVVIEVQFHTSASVTLKEKVLHKMYEDFRDPRTPLAERQRLYDEMAKHWDNIPIPDDALEFPDEKFLLRPVAVTRDLMDAPVHAMVRDMLGDGDDPNEVLATLVSLGVSDAPGLLTESMAAPTFEVKVRGRVAPVLDLYDDDTVEVAGVGKVPASECWYPTFHPTRGLSLFGSKKTADLEQDWYDGYPIPDDYRTECKFCGVTIVYEKQFDNWGAATDLSPVCNPEAIEDEQQQHTPTGPSLRISGAKKTAASNGFMVAIEPPREMAQAIHDDMVATFGDDVEPVTNYHITLAYPGDADEVDQVALESAVRDWATRWGPMTGRLSGYGVFHQDGGDKVLYASIDMPGLDRARDDLVTTLARFGIALPDDHGFTPHLTLLYSGEANTPTPPDEMPEEAQGEFTITEVALVLGGDWKHVSLESSYREDIGTARDLPWGYLPWGGNEAEFLWAGDGAGPGAPPAPPLQGSPEAAASYVAATGSLTKTADEDQCPACGGDGLMHAGVYHCQDCGEEFADPTKTAASVALALYEAAKVPVEADLHDEPEPALPVTTGEEDEEPDFVPGDPRLAHLMSGGTPATQQGDKEMNIADAAKAHLAKTALKSFSPAEQKQIIEEGSAEGVVAANLDRLDITGTHYEALEDALAAAEAEPDDTNWLL